MRGEHILYADNTAIARQGFEASMEAFGREGEHKLVGVAGSVEEVEDLIENQGVVPTVAVLDSKMPEEGDGEKAAKIIKAKFPETIIIALSSGETGWANHSLLKRGSAKDLFAFITNLKHRSE